jgi:hypothetical protein
MPTLILSPLAGGLGPYVKEDLQTIRRRTGLLMGELTYGPVLSATSSTFVLDAIARYPDNAERMVGGIAYIVAGLGAGQSRVVTSTTQATKTATIQTNWTTTPDATSIIEIWQGDRDPQEVNNAINLAILDAQELVFIPDRQNPTAIDANFRELSLPTGFVYVYGFEYKDAGGNYREYHMQYDYTGLSDGAGDRNMYLRGPVLVIRPVLSASIALADMWVLGYRRPSLLVNDTDVSDVRTDFLVFKAATLLEESKAGSTAVDPEDHGGRGSNWLREALDIRVRLQTALEPNTVEVKP